MRAAVPACDISDAAAEEDLAAGLTAAASGRGQLLLVLPPTISFEIMVTALTAITGTDRFLAASWSLRAAVPACDISDAAAAGRLRLTPTGS